MNTKRKTKYTTTAEAKSYAAHTKDDDAVQAMENFSQAYAADRTLFSQHTVMHSCKRLSTLQQARRLTSRTRCTHWNSKYK